MTKQDLPDPGPVIEVDGALDVNAVQQLGAILYRLPRGAAAGIDLGRVRDCSAFALAQLGLLLAACSNTGRRLALLGLTAAQLRLLAHLAARGVQLTSR